MPNNFKLTGDYYVSKAGSDSNDGLTPDTPLLTVQAALNKVTTAVTRTIVIGSGVYKEQILKNFALIAGNPTISLLGDGKVILEGVNDSQYISFGSTSSSSAAIVNFFNIEIRNYFAIEYASCFSAGGFVAFNNCIIKNCGKIIMTGGNTNGVIATSTHGFQFNSTTIINCVITYGYGLLGNTYDFTQYASIKMDKCILINTSFDKSSFYVGSLWQITNTYVDEKSLIKIPGPVSIYTSTLPANINFNNIQGKIWYNFSGSVSGPNSIGIALTLAQSKIDYPTYNVNSVSADPKFNNPRLLDFTLQAGSPNVSASSDYVSNIGGTEYAVPFTASSAAFTTNATSQSLEYRGIYYAISGSATTGSITSGPMFLQWPRTKPLTSVNWIGALEFNKTITASLAGNNNVPAYTTFTSASGAQGANPDRLKIRLRYSTQQTQPSTDAEWDNGGYWPAGTYQLFEPNTKPKVDYKGTGNGDPTYVETSAIGDLVPSWVQTQIILRNDYNR